MVLLLSLLYVLMLALIAAMVAQSGTLQLHMAGNDQYREEAGQAAQAVAVELARHPENFSLAAAVGHIRCGPGATDLGCDSADLQGPGSVSPDSLYAIEYSVTRREPPLWENASPRGAPRGAPGVDMAVFEIDVRIEGRGARPGRARVIQGVAVPDAVESAGISPGGAGEVAVPAAGESGDDPVESSPGRDGGLYRVYWREPGVDPL